MNSAISNNQLDQAFERFLAADVAATPLAGAELREYVASLRSAFEHYRAKDHGTIFATPKFLVLESRTPYVGYAGDQARRIELPPDVDGETLGAAVVQVLDASRKMMFDYLDGRLRPLARDEGAACHQVQMEALIARHGFKNQAAMLKVSKSALLSRHCETGVIVFSPMRRVKADHFEGLGTDSGVEVSSDASLIQIGQAVGTTLDRCL